MLNEAPCSTLTELTAKISFSVTEKSVYLKNASTWYRSKAVQLKVRQLRLFGVVAMIISTASPFHAEASDRKYHVELALIKADGQKLEVNGACHEEDSCEIDLNPNLLAQIRYNDLEYALNVTYFMTATMTGCCFIIDESGRAVEVVPVKLDSKPRKYELRYKRLDAIQAIGAKYYPFLTFGTVYIKMSKEP